MPEFQKKNKVKYLGNYFTDLYGKVGTIVDIEKDLIFVDFPGLDLHFFPCYASELELQERKEDASL